MDIVDDQTADGMLTMFDAPIENVKEIADIASIKLKTLKKMANM